VSEIVTVPVLLLPPDKVVGVRVNPVTVYGLTVNGWCWETLLNVSVIVTGSAAVTGWVVIVKVPVVEPAGIVIDAGTDATEPVLVIVETIPEGPAFALSVTVPVTTVAEPPTAELADKLRADELAD